MKDNIYIVQKGDNLYDIAKKHNTTVGIIKALNNLNSNFLQVGQELKMPTSIVEESLPSDYIIYTIKPNDNLYSIAKKYGITLEELINFNEQGTTLLNIGDQLLIPVKGEENNLTYIVSPGDTLYNIAKRYNISVDELKKKNNLESNLLKIGQTLIIPETSTYQTYIVKDNDTLDSIANYFNVSKDDIKKANNMLTDDILIGQIMIIPKK